MAHIPVMLSECLAVFKELKIKSFFDGTLGAGGFAKAFLSEHPEVLTYFACDQDRHALQTAKEVLQDSNGKIEYIHDNFRYLDKQLESRGIKSIDGFFLTWEFHQCN